MAGTALDPASAAAQGQRGRPAVRTDRFSRMFGDLPAFAEATPEVLAALTELGAPKGLMDADDPLHIGPVDLIVKPDLSPRNRDNPSHTAGITFFGQFLDHDMTFDTTSALGIPTSPEDSPNARTPGFDLDSLYGRGPVQDPQLYDQGDRAKLRVEDGGVFEDLPRAFDNTAIIGDPRNDEHLIIAGLHTALLKFHNRIVDMLRDGRGRGPDDQQVFEEARRLVTWHYHWLILHEFLPAIIGEPLLADILRGGRRFYRPRPGEQSIPIEFQGAAYRFGHSMVRPSYRANLAGDGGKAFFGFIFDPAEEGKSDPEDLRGGCRAPRRFIGWQTFFDFGNGQSTHVRQNKRIDTKISTPLFHLPLSAIASGAPPISLPQRNLLRQLTWSIPSGQAIAEAMGITPLSPGELTELATFGVGLEESTPLWYYVLKEAELRTDGVSLTGVGARIVGEVFVGLLALDSQSYLAQQPRWRPLVPGRTAGEFGLVDLLTFAEVDPASRGQ